MICSLSLQGALAIECREGDEYTQGLLHKLIDERTTFQVIAERSFMQCLEGGCSIPLGVRSEFVQRTPENDLKDVPNSDPKEVAKSDSKEIAKSEPKDVANSELKEVAKSDTAEETKPVVDVKTSDTKIDSAKTDDNVKETEAKSCETTNKKNPKRDRAHLDAISNLQLSGVVISLDGQKCIQFDCKLKDVDLDSMEDSKIDCTKIVLPTSECPKQDEVREQFISCAKLGIHLAKHLQTLGAKSILDEINKNRKPVTD